MSISSILDIFVKAALFIVSFWWVYVLVILISIFKSYWMDYINAKYISSLKWTLFEIQVSKEESLGPKAAEQIFAGLNGTGSKGNLADKFVKGKVPDWFSFEIVGIDGEIHFFIRAVSKYKNLLESLIYSQYPTAIIQEVEDYASRIPKNAPNKGYDVWGTDLILAADSHFPIRTYPLFSDMYSKDMVDPLNGISEILSKLQEGEMMVLQILIRASDGKWKDKANEAVAKMIGKKVAPTPKAGWQDTRDRFLWEFKDLGSMFFKGITLREAESEPYPEEKKPEGVGQSLIQHLSTGEKEIVGAIEMKTSKLGFESRLRLFYGAQPDVKNISNPVALMGMLKQFSIQGMNSFRPDPETITKIDYILKNHRTLYRKRLLFDKFVKRKLGSPKDTFILNIEELATIYHFPGVVSKSPMLSHVDAKRAEPPMKLPI